jgi:membrane protease YdiL (CAAX protease family)
MNKNTGRFNLYNEAPLYQIFVSLLIILGVGFALLIILLIAGMIVSGSDLSVLTKPAVSLSISDIAFMKYLLIVQDISLFIIPSIIILKLMKPESEAKLTGFRVPQPKEVILLVILAFCLFPITSFTGKINEAMHLPDWLSGVEQWMIRQEDKSDNLTESLIAAKTFPVLLLNLFLIAVLPAVGEEFIFRGVFQKIFYQLFRSGHLAIWFSAILFSTLHFQFFGFIPRLILGLIFGYLFFWSGSLWMPVISHFVNNAFPVFLSYMQDKGNLNTQTDFPLCQHAITILLSVAVCMVILFYFRRNYIFNKSF